MEATCVLNTFFQRESERKTNHRQEEFSLVNATESVDATLDIFYAALFDRLWRFEPVAVFPTDLKAASRLAA